MQPGEQRDVRHGGERHERDRATLVERRVDRVPEQVDGDPTVRPQRRGGETEVGHAVTAVDVPGVDRVLEERARGADPHRHVPAVDEVEHGQGVADDVDERGVAADAGHRPQVQARVQGGEEQGAGVVDAGVDVEHERDSLHGDDHGRSGGRRVRGRPGRRAGPGPGRMLPGSRPVA